MYLVIGGSSFIGVYVINQLLKQNCKVVTTLRNPKEKFEKYYQNKGAQVVYYDLANPNDINNLPIENVDCVILLAALLPANSVADLKQNDNSDEYIKINTLGTLSLLKYCKSIGCNKLISTTSYSDVFNNFQKDVPLMDNSTRNFNNSGDHAAYVISKNAAYDFMEYYNNQYHMNNVCFRLPPVYGVGPHSSFRNNGVVEKSGIQIFIEHAEAGEDIVIFGDQYVSRDIVYVKDVAQAFWKASITSSSKGMYNISLGKGTTLMEQASVVADIFKVNKTSKILVNNQIQNRSKSFLMSIDKAKTDFGYEPEYPTFRDFMIDYKHELKFGDIWKLFN